MNRTANAREFEMIVAMVAEHPEGIGISGLHEAISARFGNINRRTLQRRLVYLVKCGRIVDEGRSVARVYKPRAPASPAPGGAWRVAGPGASYEPYVPVSSDGAEIRAMVRQPLTQRGPAGYDLAFLERYEPGISQYLPDAIRLQLHEIGHTSAAGQAAGTYANSIVDRFSLDLSWASSRLEGNTYTRHDARSLLESGKVAAGKDILETQTILNHKAAVEMLVENAGEIDFDIFTFRNLHAVLSQNLLHDDGVSGHLRRQPLKILGTAFHPLAMPQFIEDSFKLLLDKAGAIPDPFEQAFFLMVQIPYLQPFVDVNKQVSRLGANIPLIKHNLCPMSFLDVPGLAYTEGTLGIYEFRRVELLRDVFVWAYERSCQNYLSAAAAPPAPDPLKIRYQQELIAAVQMLVRGKMAATASNIRRAASAIPGQDREAFMRLLADAMKHLDEGRLARYRLKRSEYVAWIDAGGKPAGN
ncbi:MAG: Fic family protein [Azoarcus sp.]|jgi:hypothetical protein|nr:Fic family protein [Azoarcus sp.]